MSNPYQFYLEQIHAKTGFRATWDPGRPLKLGQIGKLDPSGVFIVYSNLEDEGIPIQINPAGPASDLDYTSHESVSVTAKLSGTLPAAGSAFGHADAGFSFEFRNADSIVFQASGCRTFQITNTAEIEAAVLKKYNRGHWEKDWLIIAQVIEAASATILIANSENAVLELKANAKAMAAAIKLTDASLRLVLAREQGSILKFITQSGLTPLYRLMGIKTPFLGDPGLYTKGGTDDSLKGGLLFQDN